MICSSGVQFWSACGPSFRFSQSSNEARSSYTASHIRPRRGQRCSQVASGTCQGRCLRHLGGARLRAPSACQISVHRRQKGTVPSVQYRTFKPLGSGGAERYSARRRGIFDIYECYRRVVQSLGLLPWLPPAVHSGYGSNFCGQRLASAGAAVCDPLYALVRIM